MSLYNKENKIALYWDLDGTLTYSKWVWNYAMIDGLQKVGFGGVLPTDMEIREARQAVGFAFAWNGTREEGQKSPCGPAFWDYMDREFLRVFDHLGIERPIAQQALPYIRAYLIDGANYQLYPDSIAVLEGCRARGIPCVMISNNYPEASRTAEQLGLAPYFKEMVISGAVGLDKPNREIFEYAMGFNPDCSRHIMIGDNPIADIAGAKGAGMETVYVHREGCPDAADHCFETLMPILDLLK